MRKIALLIVIFALVAVMSSPVFALVTKFNDRVELAVEGDVMVYINFPFTVPSGNCGQLEVREYERSYSPAAASWKLLTPGSTTTSWQGIYWFKNKDSECSPIVEISGYPSEVDVYCGWKGLELEPADLGVLSTVKKSGNVFGLSEDDKEFSYNASFNPFGCKANVGTIINQLSYDIEGIIIPNQRGFLHKAVFWKDLTEKEKANFLKNTIVDRDDVIIFICREHYNY